MSSYKINDRINTFKTLKIKFNKLNHILESIRNKGGEIDIAIMNNMVDEYDKLYEDIIYPFPSHIRKKVIKKFGGKKVLPNSLEIDYKVESDVVMTNV